jgi:hypothetical protein
MAFSLSSVAGRRLLIVPALSAALLAAATTSSFATPVPPSSGAVTGTVSCGASADTAAPQATVAIAGTELVAHTDGTGKFTLSQVPVGQTLTVEALADPSGSVIATRSAITLQAGETLDVGNLDLAACPVPAAPDTITVDQYQQVQDVQNR